MGKSTSLKLMDLSVLPGEFADVDDVALARRGRAHKWRLLRELHGHIKRGATQPGASIEGALWKLSNAHLTRAPGTTDPADWARAEAAGDTAGLAPPLDDAYVAFRCVARGFFLKPGRDARLTLHPLVRRCQRVCAASCVCVCARGRVNSYKCAASSVCVRARMCVWPGTAASVCARSR